MEYINIGNVKIEKTAALAPMAGVCDTAFRTICREYGCSYVVGEMTSAKGIFYGDKKSEQLLTVSDCERPMAVQLFGDEPLTVAKAADVAMKYSPDIIDINMGCPAPKVVSTGSGSRLMTNPALAGQIVNTVSKAVPVPVTVKFRKGWDDSSVNAVEFAKIMEQNGAAAITVHGRTSKQMYAPPVDLDIIKAVKDAVTIPVIGNGDITDIKSAVHMYEYTGCDLIMIGRGSLGNPFLFSQLRAYFDSGIVTEKPTLIEKMDCLKCHIALSCMQKGEYTAVREARKHAAWYIKGIRDAGKYRGLCSSLNSFDDILHLIDNIILSNSET